MYDKGSVSRIAIPPLPGVTGKPFNIASYALLTHLLAQPEILRKASSIHTYDSEDFVIHDYQAQAHIKAAVAV